MEKIKDIILLSSTVIRNQILTPGSQVDLKSLLELHFPENDKVVGFKFVNQP